jgi:predicted lipid-binding transport protein (Tim44 family)
MPRQKAWCLSFQIAARVHYLPARDAPSRLRNIYDKKAEISRPQFGSTPMPDMLDPSTIVFALLAIFVLWKLRSALGTRTGNEKPPPVNSFFRRTIGTNDNKVVPLPGAAPPPVPNPPPNPDRWKVYAEPGSKVAAGLDAIASASPDFALDPFVAGAKAAYEMIVSAFASGDRQTLQNLLDKDVLDSFTAAIAARESRSESMTTQVVSIDQVIIEDAGMRNRSAQITLRFMSKLINATHDKSGALIDGNPDKSVDMIDIWTFAHDVDSRDPNWKLIATQTGH